MRCPFPGMDPYIERAEIWPDFHDRLVTYISGQLQPMLRPRYAAIIEERQYVLESEGPIRADVGLHRRSRVEKPTGRLAVVEPDVPLVFDLFCDEVVEPYLRIIELAAESRCVTAIEIVSPNNTAEGPGRVSYLECRERHWREGVNLVEIGLLRQGPTTMRVPPVNLTTLVDWRLLVVVHRVFPTRREVYSIPLTKRLPRVAVPLLSGEPDVVLDLQAAFERCWNSGPYPELLRYDQPPPADLTAEEQRWCAETLRGAKLI
ncbi:MAG: DUF4058 family protein [Pirellulales bacterium]